jgi:hypothetical protein
MACNCSGQRCACNFEVVDTFTIDATLLGSGSSADPWLLSQNVRIDPDGMITVTLSGLLALVSGIDGDCTTLTGDGSPGNPLRVDVNISALPGNVASCAGDGIFVPAVAAGAVQYTGQIKATVAQVIPVFAVNSLSAQIEFDTVVFDVGGITDIANDQFLIPAGGQGYYHIEATIPTTGATNSGGTGGYVDAIETVFFEVNGAALLDGRQVFDRASALGRTNTHSFTHYLNAGDTVDVWDLIQVIAPPNVVPQTTQFAVFTLTMIGM